MRRVTGCAASAQVSCGTIIMFSEEIFRLHSFHAFRSVDQKVKKLIIARRRRVRFCDERLKARGRKENCVDSSPVDLSRS